MHRKIVIEGAFSGHFAKLLDGLRVAPATDKPVWRRAIVKYVENVAVGDGFDQVSATQLRLHERAVNEKAREDLARLFDAARSGRLRCLARFVPFEMDGEALKDVWFDMDQRDVVDSDLVIVGGRLNEATRGSVCALVAVAGCAIRCGSPTGPFRLPTKCFEEGPSFGDGGLKYVLKVACGLCAGAAKKKKRKKKGKWLLAAGAAFEVVAYSLDDPSDVLIMKRKGSNHRPWSELPETKAGIDARIADSQRCVAIFDVAHCKSFFDDVSKAEVAVDAFDASGTA